MDNGIGADDLFDATKHGVVISDVSAAASGIAHIITRHDNMASVERCEVRAEREGDATLCDGGASNIGDIIMGSAN